MMFIYLSFRGEHIPGFIFYVFKIISFILWWHSPFSHNLISVWGQNKLLVSIKRNFMFNSLGLTRHSRRRAGREIMMRIFLTKWTIMGTSSLSERSYAWKERPQNVSSLKVKTMSTVHQSDTWNLGCKVNTKKNNMLKNN